MRIFPVVGGVRDVGTVEDICCMMTKPCERQMKLYKDEREQNEEDEGSASPERS